MYSMARGWFPNATAQAAPARETGQHLQGGFGVACVLRRRQLLAMLGALAGGQGAVCGPDWAAPGRDRAAPHGRAQKKCGREKLQLWGRAQTDQRERPPARPMGRPLAPRAQYPPGVFFSPTDGDQFQTLETWISKLGMGGFQSLGHRFPKLGTIFSKVWDGFFQSLGRFFPNFGKNFSGAWDPLPGPPFQSLGPTFPNFGTIFPNFGTNFPKFGTIFPKFGAIFPNFGMIFPNFGVIFSEVWDDFSKLAGGWQTS